MAKTVYDESKIKTLSSLEHIRLRSGMYVGRLGDGTNPDDGIYIMLKEIIDNSIDEFIMGNGSSINLTIASNGMVSIRDFGRGIPFGKLVDCVTVINTGAKYDDSVFQFSVGLNGVGTKAVNALSEYFRIVSYRDGKAAEASFVRGTLQKQKTYKESKEKSGLLVEFRPDPEIFGTYAFEDEHIHQRLWSYAYLNIGLTLKWNGAVYKSEYGLQDFLNSRLGEQPKYTICWYRSQFLEFACTHCNNYGESYFSFVNGQYTSDGGTHLSAFREGILKGVNEHFNTNYSGVDVREGISSAVAVRIQNPMFESQTKNKLGNNDIRPWIVSETKTAILDFLLKNQDAANTLRETIMRNEQLRKELTSVRKQARAAASQASLNIANLRDCKYHRSHSKHGEESTIFITEGRSAAGAMVGARNVYTQAIFALRGKPRNMIDGSKADIYRNLELYNLVVALGIENDLETLRYERIVIASDADHDGYHIRNLLLTFFLTYFEDLIHNKHLFFLETPLYRVRNSKENRYCYSDAERDTAVKEINNPEVTRFKGLGEISSHEFREFLGENIRLLPTRIRSRKECREAMQFYMGRNTPERQQFIIKHLQNLQT